jgi:hypothetical protein
MVLRFWRRPLPWTDKLTDKRAGWVFWSVVALLLPVLYLGALGPASWFTARFGGANAVTFVYRPLTSMAQVVDRSLGGYRIMNAVQWYSGVAAPAGWKWDHNGRPGTAEWCDVIALEAEVAKYQINGP